MGALKKLKTLDTNEFPLVDLVMENGSSRCFYAGMMDEPESVRWIEVAICHPSGGKGAK